MQDLWNKVGKLETKMTDLQAKVTDLQAETEIYTEVLASGKW